MLVCRSKKKKQILSNKSIKIKSHIFFSEKRICNKKQRKGCVCVLTVDNDIVKNNVGEVSAETPTRLPRSCFL